MSDIWAVVHAERRTLADDLSGLTADQWATPSLCDGWDVHDVLAHLVATAKETRLRFVTRLVRAGFDFDRANARVLAAERASDPRDTLAELRAVVDWTATPPAPLITRIIEAYVHGEDIRRPLGIEHEYPLHQVQPSLEYFARERFSGGKARLEGLSLQATDAGFTVGRGEVVEGPGMSLLLAASGRAIALADLTGQGVATLRQRL